LSARRAPLRDCASRLLRLPPSPWPAMSCCRRKAAGKAAAGNVSSDVENPPAGGAPVPSPGSPTARNRPALLKDVDGSIGQADGEYRLEAGGKCLEGWYKYRGGLLYDDEDHKVGCFSQEPVGSRPIEADLFSRPATRGVPAVAVQAGEIMEAIQDPRNAGAVFVLPSQLNGAKYPSSEAIVQKIQAYVDDDTGGARGQLAVHPAVGQFLLDNAATSQRTGGINAIKEILASMSSASGFALQNGYLKMPTYVVGTLEAELWSKFQSNLHTLRVLTMQDVPACGMLPQKQALSPVSHTVSLVYASAVPVEAYVNKAPADTVAGRLHRQIAEAVLFAQYFGAMSQAAARAPAGKQTTVFLMPLGGGTFNNPVESIAKAISLAVEKLEGEGLLKALDIRVLAWKGDAREASVFKGLFQNLNKFREHSADTLPTRPGQVIVAL